MEDLLAVLAQAVAARASDVYLLPKPAGYAVVLRQARGLVALDVVSPATGQRWLNYLKYQAGMNVTEHRRVQLGAYTPPQLAVPLRLSTVADHTGQETLVARLLYGVPALDAFTAPLVARLQTVAQARGMVAVSGPTGSGKTTLLYQLATALAQEQMVMTIEDPVEIVQPAFLQLQVNPAAGMTYAALLKAALRHRPDVLLIGELRDFDTAQQACEAAISGHLVLTTVHARSAALVAPRLVGLGVAPALVTAALVASAAVRLVHTPVTHPEVVLRVVDEGGRVHEETA
ncbi:ATPase, T2SS/T4P/T4SS family [Lacticaseibacillus daqingensis]|uniref:ATPase, T2SS/T4P/T4SS family n=1 Tax=Lacticaseibacillus daqingensis TaxID=2486014 RepID=UPI000F77DB94|nr:ATPase, T2SS/T4P/T4SS family [Lacticaseibacillus daqingensis]